MKHPLIFILTFLILICGPKNIYASSGPIKALKQRLKTFKSEAHKIRTKMDRVESKMKHKNKKLIFLLQEKSELENDLLNLEQSYQEQSSEFDKLRTRAQAQLKKLSIQLASNQNDTEQFFYSTILKKKLLKAMRELDLIKKELSVTRKKMKKGEKLLRNLDGHEQKVNLQILAFESQFQTMSKTYDGQLKQSQKLRSKVQWQLDQAKLLFSSPFRDYKKKTKSKKGVYFVLTGRNEVLASKQGRIIYTGTMGSYGNVIMIQHLNNHISVYLGPIEIKVKRGFDVKKGETLGYSDLKSEQLGSVYFEIRKKNKPQNTIGLLDKV